MAGLLGGVEQVALAGGALVRLGPRLHLVVGVPATDAEADLRQAVQTAVSFTRDEHRPAYRDAVQGVCQAIDALDPALAQARNVTQAYQQAAPPEPLRRGRPLPPLDPMLPNIDRLLAWRDDYRRCLPTGPRPRAARDPSPWPGVRLVAALSREAMGALALQPLQNA